MTVGYRPRRTLPVRVELVRQIRRRRTQVAFALVALLPVILWGAFELAQDGPPTGSLNLVDLAKGSATNFAVFALFFNTGPSNTIIANVIPAGERAAAFALNILIIHAIGDALSPLLIGWIADVSSLKIGFVVVSFTIAVGGVFWLLGCKHLEQDTLRAAGG